MYFLNIQTTVKQGWAKNQKTVQETRINYFQTSSPNEFVRSYISTFTDLELCEKAENSAEEKSNQIIDGLQICSFTYVRMSTIDLAPPKANIPTHILRWLPWRWKEVQLRWIIIVITWDGGSKEPGVNIKQGR